MAAQGQTALLEGFVWSSLAPCVMIILTVVAFSFVGESLATRLSRSV
jgi:peptide/nickel transport system permease protein